MDVYLIVGNTIGKDIWKGREVILKWLKSGSARAVHINHHVGQIGMYMVSYDLFVCLFVCDVFLG